MRHPYGQSITILRSTPGGRDMPGDPIASTVDRIDVPGCAIAPRTSTEPSGRGRQGVIVGLTIYAPAGTDIRATDSIEIAEQTYTVDGEPGEWTNPFNGATPGLEVAVTRAEG